MKKAEMITGVFLLVLSGFAIQEAWRMPSSATFGPGAGFLPFWLGVLLAVLATILFVSAWRSQATEKDSKPVFPGKQALFAITSVLVGLAGYILLIEVLGYLVDTFLFIVFLMKTVEHEKWPLTLMVAVSTTAVLFITFQFLLRITLPSNIFGF
ncbi:MAG: tripartite tricarboxylate transporter TctB family protein [Deltaproteobacteria bacterium]|nr:MAG: tripartite tricarboxylate transporter TctB family protein [Deltaproteobacteria bacterium]